jgi:gas vesicle protein
MTEVAEQESPKELFKLPKSPEKFLSDIMDAYPSDFLTLRKVISLGKVEYSPSKRMTAAIMNTKPFTLIFGKHFMENNLESIDDAVFLLAHELTHIVLGHFSPDILKIFKEVDEETKEEKNFAARVLNFFLDFQVNATCYHSLKEEKYMAFIKRYYPQDQMPFCFLRPDGIAPDEYKDVHEKLYSEAGISNRELVERLYPWFKENREQAIKALKKGLLGNHSSTGEDQLQEEGGGGDGSLNDLEESYVREVEDILPEVKDELKEYMEKQKAQAEEAKSDQEEEDEEETEVKAKKSSGKMAGTGNELRKCQVRVVKEKLSQLRQLEKRLKRNYVICPTSKILQVIDSFNPKQPTRTVIPNFRDPRTVALYARNQMPIFHHNPHLGSKVKVICYLDVSDSQDHVLPHTIDAVSKLRRVVGDTVYCFSTQIAEASLNTLRKGTYFSSGGTCFNCVASHILENKFRNVLILTDGHAWLDEELQASLRRAGTNIKVGWTVRDPSREPLNQVAKETHMLGFD